MFHQCGPTNYMSFSMLDPLAMWFQVLCNTKWCCHYMRVLLQKMHNIMHVAECVAFCVYGHAHINNVGLVLPITLYNTI